MRAVNNKGSTPTRPGDGGEHVGIGQRRGHSGQRARNLEDADLALGRRGVQGRVAQRQGAIGKTELTEAGGEPVQAVGFVVVGGEKGLVLPVGLAVQAVLHERDGAQVGGILTRGARGALQVEAVAGEPAGELALVGGFNLAGIEA